MRPIPLALAGVLAVSLVAFADDDEAPPKKPAKETKETKEAKETTTAVHDHLYKFTIDSPKFEEAKKTEPVHVLSLLGPAKDGFAPNVNVMIQPPMSRKDYLKQTIAALSTAGMSLNSKKNGTVCGRDSVLVDYEGKMAGRDLRFLALAVFDEAHVYLVTCTTLADEFEASEKSFKACLETFKLDDEKF